MFIYPDSHPDWGRTSISEPNHHVIQTFISAVQSKVSLTKSLSESNETDRPITELDLHANMVFLCINAFF